MKLFWGLIETTPKHQHSFDAKEWNFVDEYLRTATDKFTGHSRELGHVYYYKNTCLTCGDMVERVFSHTKD